MTDEVEMPPRPGGRSEMDRAEEMLGHAKRAVEFTEMAAPMWRSAEQEFFRSWLAMLQAHADDAEESRHRQLAWDRAEQAEEKLRQIGEIVASAEARGDGAKAFAFGRIEEVLSS